MILLTAGAAPDSMIRGWTMQSQKCVRLLRGHKNSITSLLPLKDGITLLSASKENEIFVWNMSTGKLFNKVAHHTGSINALLLLKDNARFVSASNDKSFCLWKINYGYSNDFNRRMFHSCDIEKKFLDVCEIYSLNSATTNPYIVVTGGSDNKIKIWNVEIDQCIQEINAHCNGIAELVYFENPFKMNTKDNFMILSIGFDEDVIVMSKSSLESGIVAARDSNISFAKGYMVQNRMQIIKGKDGALKIIIASQGADKKIVVWTFA